MIVLDSAGYGPVTTTKAVSLTAPPDVYAGISVFSGDDRKIDAGFNLGQLTGNANITLIMGPGINQHITVSQTNVHPTCKCP